MEEKIKIKVNRIIQFFDEKPKDSWGHATSVVAVAGEDLGIGLLKHYLENVQKAKVSILNHTPTTGKRKGPRLDRWIDVIWSSGTGNIFQVEIKNWSAHAIGGEILPLDASMEEIKRYKIRRWKDMWDMKHNVPSTENVAKVLLPMMRPETIDKSHILEPLVIYWVAIHPEGNNEPFFNRKLGNDQAFSKIWFFSISPYLRSLKQDTIEVYMPSVVKRMVWLSQLFCIL